jgi:hypothetical protein
MRHLTAGDGLSAPRILATISRRSTRIANSSALKLGRLAVNASIDPISKLPFDPTAAGHLTQHRSSWRLAPDPREKSGRHPPLYVSSAENAPEGAIAIERVFVDPPERPEAPLLVAEDPAGKDVFGGTEKRKWLIDYPNLGIA